MQVANLTPRASGLEPAAVVAVVDLRDDPQAAIISPQQVIATAIRRPCSVGVARMLRLV
jgi:hypothetical protein